MKTKYDLARCEQEVKNLSIAEANLIIDGHDRQISKLRDEIEDHKYEIDELKLEKRTHTKKVEGLING